MYLQIPRNNFRTNTRPPVAGGEKLAFDTPAGALFAAADAGGDVNLPLMATANDLREVVKFFKHKPHGVSLVEVATAEPRRVFDARKIAAYKFWGVLDYRGERLFLTPLGEELARNTEAECEIHRRILRQVPAYSSAVEHIYRQRLKIATYRDVANFWTHSVENLHLSPQNEEHIEAVIVSFFSLCHAAELGTATVGKRGQPARLSVRLDEIRAFLSGKPPKQSECVAPRPAVIDRDLDELPAATGEPLARVYIAADAERAETLVAALELADFAGAALGAEVFPSGFLPAARMNAMRRCQAAIFLLDERDGLCEDGRLRCERITEISVAQALYGERVVVLWHGRTPPPAALAETNVQLFTGEELDWETNVRLVKCLKSLKS